MFSALIRASSCRRRPELRLRGGGVDTCAPSVVPLRMMSDIWLNSRMFSLLISWARSGRVQTPGSVVQAPQVSAHTLGATMKQVLTFSLQLALAVGSEMRKLGLMDGELPFPVRNAVQLLAVKLVCARHLTLCGEPVRGHVSLVGHVWCVTVSHGSCSLQSPCSLSLTASAP